MRNNRVKAIVLAVAAATGSQFSFGQLMLEEVVVTAQKKAESLVEAPLSVNLFSEDTMHDAGIFQADELGKLTSGVEIRFEGDSNTGVGIRGIGTFSTQSAPPRVSTYVDNFFIGSQQDFAFASLYDMAQVQILRGPQGTLYGQPSPSGALILETANPNLDEIEGFVRGSYQADPQGYNVQGAISVPIIEGVLGVRLAVLSDDRETGLENIVQDFDEERGRDGARIKVLWEPTDTFSANFGYSWLRSEDSDTYTILESTSPDSDFQLDAEDRTSIQNSNDALVDKKDFMMTLNLTWDLDWGTINWFSGDFGSSNKRDSDDDGLQYTALNQDVTNTQFHKNVQHELRITMSPTEWWEVQFGAFSQNAFAQTDVRSLAGVANQGVFEIILDIPTGNKTKAIFAHNDFFISDATTLTVGIRYNEFEADAASIIDNRFHFGSELGVNNEISAPLVIIEGALPCVADLSQTPPCENRRKETDKEWTGTVKLSHAFSDELNVYATIDHGFRPGAPNFDVNGSFQATPEDPSSDLNFFDGESVNSIEFGAKGDIWDGRGQYTSAIFYSVYDDYQLRPSFELWNSFSAGGSVASISNADVNVDEAVQMGIEGELRYLATENLELFGSFSWAQVELSDGVVPCTDASQTPVSASNRFNVCDADGVGGSIQPELSATFMANYTRQIDAFGGSDWYANALVNYRGDVEVPGDEIGAFDSDGYVTADFFTGIRADGWDAQLFIKNIFDEEGILARRPQSGAGQSFATAVGGTAFYNELSITPPRTVGVTASFYF